VSRGCGSDLWRGEGALRRVSTGVGCIGFNVLVDSCDLHSNSDRVEKEVGMHGLFLALRSERTRNDGDL
jgi:hypothetical protein